jgi:hypothetical protein
MQVFLPEPKKKYVLEEPHTAPVLAIRPHKAFIEKESTKKVKKVNEGEDWEYTESSITFPKGTPIIFDYYVRLDPKRAHYQRFIRYTFIYKNKPIKVERNVEEFNDLDPLKVKEV